MPQRPSKPPAPKWAGLSKNLALWLLVFLLAVFVVKTMSRQGGGAAELSLTEFNRQV